jgi:hypothetical protein
MPASSTPPYVIGAIITAIPATLAASAGWYSAHRGRKEGHDDTSKIEQHIGSFEEKFDRIETRFEKIDLAFARMDLRFDTIEDNVERHLGWHRAEAEEKLEQTLKKEAKSDNPTNQFPTFRPQD